MKSLDNMNLTLILLKSQVFHLEELLHVCVCVYFDLKIQ